MIYLDHAATTPLDPLVLAAMMPFLQEHFANPASIHRPGQLARKGVQLAREQVAASIAAPPEQIIFNSGATEGINHALRSLFSDHSGHLISSQLEHAATLQTAAYLQTQGVEVSLLEPDAKGQIVPEAVAAAIQDNTRVISLMLVNNETGVINDIQAIAKIAKKRGIAVCCDAVQAYGVMDIQVNQLGVNIMTLSGHKVYGPKGVGVLYSQIDLEPLIHGGQQERGFRGGTLNTPAIVGMGQAAALSIKRWQDDSERMSLLRDDLQNQLLKLNDIHINGQHAPRAAKHLSVTAKGVDAEALLMALDSAHIHLSAGSACAAGSLEPSHVLMHMGLSERDARSSLRFSLGRTTSKEEVDQAAASFAEGLERCRMVYS